MHCNIHHFVLSNLGIFIFIFSLDPSNFILYKIQTKVSIYPTLFYPYLSSSNKNWINKCLKKLDVFFLLFVHDEMK